MKIVKVTVHVKLYLYMQLLYMQRLTRYLDILDYWLHTLYE